MCPFSMLLVCSRAHPAIRVLSKTASGRIRGTPPIRTSPADAHASACLRPAPLICLDISLWQGEAGRGGCASAGDARGSVGVPPDRGRMAVFDKTRIAGPCARQPRANMGQTDT